MTGDTIFALASGRLPAAIAVIRISGAKSRFALETISGKTVEPRRLHLRSLREAEGGLIDQCMLVFFPGPRSETGEDCGEFHLHGGRTVVASVFARLTALGLRPAEPGEFSRRAFLNGKIDLVQAEAVADLVAAETEAQRRFAAGNLEGRQSSLYAGWRQRLLHARAMIEAELDFSDEGDVPGSLAETIWADMAALHAEVLEHIGGYAKAIALREGFQVIIVGAPNAGKSSLLNALAKRDAAIVSEEPGTTRDLIEVPLDLSGLKVRLVDTAGLRDDAESKVERIGIERARGKVKQADFVIHLTDLSAAVGIDPPAAEAPLLKVGTKLDLISSPLPAGYDLLVSAQDGTGIGKLLEILRGAAEAATGAGTETLPSRERHVVHLREASAHLEQVLHAALPLEIRAEELRLTGAALASITGHIDTEDVLGAIFSSFCVGK